MFFWCQNLRRALAEIDRKDEFSMSPDFVVEALIDPPFILFCLIQEWCRLKDLPMVNSFQAIRNLEVPETDFSLVKNTS